MTADISTFPGPNGEPVPLVLFTNDAGAGMLAVSFSDDRALFTTPSHPLDFEVTPIMLSPQDRQALGRWLLDSSDISPAVALTLDPDCLCDPDYRYGYDDRCPVHGYRATKTEKRP